MALSATSISAGIAALSITGMTSIRDVTNIPEEVTDPMCPVMFPNPDEWLQGGRGAQEAETTFGPPSSRYWVVHRTYGYVWCYKLLGSGRGLSSYYSGGSTMLDAIVTALVALDVDGVDVESITHTKFGAITDPAGIGFAGAFIQIACRERINP